MPFFFVVQVLESPSFHFLVVKQAMQLAFDKRERECGMVAQWFVALIERDLMSPLVFLQGFELLLSVLMDYEVDAPRALEFCAIMIAPLTLQPQPKNEAEFVLSLNYLSTQSSSLSDMQDTGRCAKLAALVLQHLTRAHSQEEARRVLPLDSSASADVVIEWFLPLMRERERKSESVRQLLEKYELNYLLQ
jgi:hypothetical protein